MPDYTDCECGRSLLEHQQMVEAKASAEIEGAKTNKTICELLQAVYNN